MLERTSSDELDDSSLIMEAERKSMKDLDESKTWETLITAVISFELEIFTYIEITIWTILNQNFDGSRSSLMKKYTEIDEFLLLIP